MIISLLKEQKGKLFLNAKPKLRILKQSEHNKVRKPSTVTTVTCSHVLSYLKNKLIQFLDTTIFLRLFCIVGGGGEVVRKHVLFTF